MNIRFRRPTKKLINEIYKTPLFGGVFVFSHFLGKYYPLTFFMVIIYLFMGCNLYRPGPVVRQGGAKKNVKYHTKTAHSKVKKRK